jgi:hypothetical protein
MFCCQILAKLVAVAMCNSTFPSYSVLATHDKENVLLYQAFWLQRREEELGLSEEAAAEIDTKRAELSEARKARDPNVPGLATGTDLEGFSCTLSQPLHSPSTTGILSLALAPTNPTTEPSIVATGAHCHLQTPDHAEFS